MKTIIIDGIEYNLTPKVLFKKGDFVVIQETTYLISKIEGLNVTLSCNGRDCLFDIDVLKSARLWDITKDAKDGDVLFTSSTASHETFIFKSIDEKGNAKCYFAYDSEDGFREGKYHFIGSATNCKPATKEQRDTLEKAMADAGYTFDFEKKELKNIKQKSAEWSEEDEEIHRKCICAMRASACGFPEEEKFVEQVDNWFKCLKERYTWKPSVAQLNALSIVSKGYVSDDIEAIVSLYNDLKKLKGE